jgi:hypothetical protein
LRGRTLESLKSSQAPPRVSGRPPNEFTLRRGEIFSITPTLTGSDPSVEELKQKCDRLSGYLSNSLQLIAQITNSGEVQNALGVSEGSRDDFKSGLLIHFARIEGFLNENGYETHPFNLDPDVSSAEELLIAFQQSQSVNDLLVRISNEMKHQLEFLLSDRQVLCNQNRDLHESLENGVEDSKSEFLDDLLRKDELIQELRRSVTETGSDFAISCKSRPRFSVIIQEFIQESDFGALAAKSLSRLDEELNIKFFCS